MKPEDQEVSLELAQQMKELGVDQDSAFAWYQYVEGNPYIALKALQNCQDSIAIYHDGYAECPKEICDAPTVAELGEMLKGEIVEGHETIIKENPYYLDCGKIESEHTYYVRYIRHDPSDTLCITHANKEADARAKIVICLIRAGIIEAEEIGK